MSETIYVFSGLGADERVFQKLKFEGYNYVFIKWILPYKDETIQNYSLRLINQIKTPKPILIGLSFGGIIAIEVSKIIETTKIILLSSVKTKYEIPLYYRLLGKLGFHKIIPTSFLKSSNFITNWFFGVNSEFDKQLLKQILMETNPVFLNWAIEKIIMWSNILVFDNIYHIHGNKDHILPNCFLKADAIINDGGHFMVLNKSLLINKIILRFLGN